MSAWKLVLAPVQPPATRKLLKHIYWPELSFLLEDSAGGDWWFTPPSGGKESISAWDHYSCIWTNIPIDPFPIILPTYKGFHFAGIAFVIFRACYCLWLCHLGSAKTSDQQPFWELPSAAFARWLAPAFCLYLIRNTATSLVISFDVLLRVPHNSPLLL